MTVITAYDIGDIVYLVTDDNQKKRIVTAISICVNGAQVYQLSCGIEITKHYEFELSDVENILIK